MSAKPSAPNVEALLVPPFPKTHIDASLKHFSKAADYLREQDWEAALGKLSKFIEAALKALYVHVGRTLPTGRGFKADAIINGLAQFPDGSFHDSIRLTIPRAGRFVYDVASNRGGRHDSDEVDANEMDAVSVMAISSWILAEMIRVAQKGAVDLTAANELVATLVEKRYPLVENLDGRLYFHVKKKTATDVALLALAHVHPRRIAKDELIDTVSRNGFTKNNAQMAVSRVAKFVDDDGSGNLRLLSSGLKKAEDLFQA